MVVDVPTWFWIDAAWWTPVTATAWIPTIFGPVWSVLYVLIAIAGWRTFTRDARGTPMQAWLIQMALNFSWSPVFFGAHLIDAAFVVIGALLCAIVAFIVLSWPKDRVAALLFVPYAAWVAFATLLNGAIMRLN